MYEHMTYEYFMERSLASVSLDLDKRQSSIIYAALAVQSAELAGVYAQLDAILKLVFAQDSAGEWLEKRTEESGVDKREAVKAKRRATFNIPVDVGERFFVNDLYFVVVDEGIVECETAGVVGNTPMSDSNMLPVSNIPDLELAILGEIIIPGEDDESDESLLERYLIKRRRKATSANKAHYKKWAEEVEGVGKAKVIPLWAGEGTVKVIIVNSEMKPASSELVQAVQDYIDPVPGMGEGEAPVGARLTVESAANKEISIQADVSLRGNTAESVAKEIADELERVFKGISFTDSTEIKMSLINNVLFRNKWVEDYSNVLINGESNNLALRDNEVPFLVGVVLNG